MMAAVHPEWLRPSFNWRPLLSDTSRCAGVLTRLQACRPILSEDIAGQLVSSAQKNWAGFAICDKTGSAVRGWACLPLIYVPLLPNCTLARPVREV